MGPLGSCMVSGAAPPQTSSPWVRMAPVATILHYDGSAWSRYDQRERL